jgi:hypothetical protein
MANDVGFFRGNDKALFMASIIDPQPTIKKTSALLFSLKVYSCWP